MTAHWLPRSLAVRVTLLCGLIAFAMTGMLGGVFYWTARVGIVAHADEQLIARAEHFRKLVADARTVAELHDRSTFFEDLLGAASDVLILRGADGATLVEINPDHAAVPAGLPVAASGRSVAPGDVREVALAGHPRMRWVAGVARTGPGGVRVDVVAGHPLVDEARMIGDSRDKAWRATLVAMLGSVLGVYAVVRHGLRPLRRVARQAALIDPLNLALRLPGDDAPRELQEMVAVFNAMLDRIASGYERLSQFSADLAHEIRTPVGALIGQTQVALNRTRDAAEYQRVLESNLEELNRLRLIADNILFLAQADHAQLDIERTPLEMVDELQRIAEYFDGPADEATLRFAVEASGTLRANATLCRRAIHNLVVNALRYAAPDTTVRLVGTQDAAGATIAVENDGLPIPDDQLRRLFDRFYRADAARGRPAESSGLGLAIVQAIMALHGGEARVACSPSGTIRFELRFPA